MLITVIIVLCHHTPGKETHLGSVKCFGCAAAMRWCGRMTAQFLSTTTKRGACLAVHAAAAAAMALNDAPKMLAEDVSMPFEL